MFCFLKILVDVSGKHHYLFGIRFCAHLMMILLIEFLHRRQIVDLILMCVFLDKMIHSKIPHVHFGIEIHDIVNLRVTDGFGAWFDEKQLKLYNAAIAGCFYIEQKATTKWIVRYESSLRTMKSFDILIAISEQDQWKCEYRLFVNENQVFCSKLDPTFNLLYGRIPDPYKKDTVLVLCIKSTQMNMVIKQNCVTIASQ